jgi:uncharacterized protein (UPF0276 family)
MNLAINYSPQAASLLNAGKIQLDYFKCPDWPDLISQAQILRPTAVHFEISASAGKLSHKDWSIVDHLLEETGTRFINLHLASNIKDFPGTDLNYQEPTQRRVIIDKLIADVGTLVDRFGPERVIAENIPYRGIPGHAILRPAGEPEVIREVIETSGCGLLLDISHACMSAHYLGMEEKEYMLRLPVNHLRELHFAGIHVIHGILRDHLSIQPLDWLSLDWVLENIRRGEWSKPWMLACEYGGVGEVFEWRSDPQVIAEQMPRLYEMVKTIP